MLYLILIIFVIVLKVENNHLKEMIRKRVNFCPKCGYDLYKQRNCFVNDNKSIIYSNKASEDKNKFDGRENNLFFLVGSILIVISALIFITSTWSIMGNIFKIMIIFASIFLFFGISIVALNKFNLPNTAKTFFYMGVSYIPIALIAISFFSLFGKYFSIYGKGNLLYLGFSSLLVFVIYYLISIHQKNSVLGIVSFLFNIIGIILLCCFFIKDINIILIVIEVYNLVLIFLYKIKIYLYNKKNSCLYINGINIFVFIIGFYYNLFFFEKGISCLFLILFLIGTTTIFNEQRVKNYISSSLGILFAICLGGNLYFVLGSILVLQIILLIAYLSIFIIDIIINDRINPSSYIIISIFNFIMLYTLYFNGSMPLYLYIFIYSLISLIYYWYANNKNIVINIIIVFMELSMFILSVEYSYLFSIFLMLSLVIYFIGKSKDRVSEVIWFIVFSISSIIVNINLYFLLLILCIFIIYNLYKNLFDKISFFYIFMISFVLVKIFSFSFDVSKYIFVMVIILINFIYYFIKKKDLYLFVIYTFLFILFKFVIYDLNINNISFINIGVSYLYLIIVIRRIICKYINRCDLIEYILFIGINILAIYLYHSKVDGLLYIAFLTFLSFVGYLLKDKVLVVSNLLFIFINIVLVTSSFWLSIPWWLYILIIGIILILFAISNERRKNNK
mgnify:FL=1